MRDRLAVAARVLARAWLPYWLLSAGLFVAAATVGAAVGYENPGTPWIGLDTTDRSAWYFFSHNAGVTGLAVVGAPLAALPTVYLLLFNGFLFGSTMVDAAGELGPLLAVALVLPHGVFELPALWLGGAVSFRWVHVAARVVDGRGPRYALPDLLVQTVLALAATLLLLAVAAVVEAEVSLRLARLAATVCNPTIC